MMKTSLLLAVMATTFALAAWFGSQALAVARTDPAAPAVDRLQEPTPPAGITPEPFEAGSCGDQDCSDDSDCSSACPSASSAICDSNYSCQFFFGGTGPSPGGGSCPDADCSDDSDCRSNCPGASVAICSSEGLCLY